MAAEAERLEERRDDAHEERVSKLGDALGGDEPVEDERCVVLARLVRRRSLPSILSAP